MGVLLDFDPSKRKIRSCEDCKFKVEGVFALCKRSPLPTDKDQNGVIKPFRILGGENFFLLDFQLSTPYKYCKDVNPGGRCRKFVPKKTAMGAINL